MVEKYVIFDLDGTLADIEHRKHFIEVNDWDSFYKACVDDKPKKDIIELLDLYNESCYKSVIFSGRSDIVKNETLDWCSDNGIFFDHFVMRKEGDYTPDDILKNQFLEDFLKERRLTISDIRVVVDDRDKVVKMWRSLGLTCLQVADGNF